MRRKATRGFRSRAQSGNRSLATSKYFVSTTFFERMSHVCTVCGTPPRLRDTAFDVLVLIYTDRIIGFKYTICINVPSGVFEGGWVNALPSMSWMINDFYMVFSIPILCTIIWCYGERFFRYILLVILKSKSKIK